MPDFLFTMRVPSCGLILCAVHSPPFPPYECNMHHRTGSFEPLHWGVGRLVINRLRLIGKIEKISSRHPPAHPELRNLKTTVLHSKEIFLTTHSSPSQRNLFTMHVHFWGLPFVQGVFPFSPPLSATCIIEREVLGRPLTVTAGRWLTGCAWLQNPDVVSGIVLLKTIIIRQSRSSIIPLTVNATFCLSPHPSPTWGLSKCQILPPKWNSLLPPKWKDPFWNQSKTFFHETNSTKSNHFLLDPFSYGG